MPIIPAFTMPSTGAAATRSPARLWRTSTGRCLRSPTPSRSTRCGRRCGVISIRCTSSTPCRSYHEASHRIALSRERIPQLTEVNATIQPLLGFSMVPVAGLVAAKAFLSQLGGDVFLSTQYMRHHSVPLYTPEPDVVHELIGHAATFADPTFVALTRAFGEAALRAQESPETIERIGRLYWYTLEFGVLREAGRLRVYGAGLLSSFGEPGRFEGEEQLHGWSVDEIADTPYDPTMYQKKLFVAPGFDAMANDVLEWLTRV